MDDCTHLGPDARAVIGQSADARIDWLAQERWIGYSRAQEALAQLTRLLNHPPTHRMPNLLLLGYTNNGKTTIVRYFAEQHPPRDDPESDALHYPVVMIQMPQVPQEQRFYEELLDQLGAPYRRRDPVQQKLRQVRTLFANLKVRMLIIDEIHHLLGGRIEQQRVFLNTLKFLGHDLKIPIVGVGTVDALRAIQIDPQLANRFKPFALPKWTLDEEFRKLLASFECLLPLRLPSQLHRGEYARELLRLSEGTIGDLAELLNEAAGEAIRSGHERIDRELLAGLPWIPPSARRQRANEMTQ